MRLDNCVGLLGSAARGERPMRWARGNPAGVNNNARALSPNTTTVQQVVWTGDYLWTNIRLMPLRRPLQHAS